MSQGRKKQQQLKDWLVVAVLFGIALWLRASNLAHFVTADEHNWVYRSGLFLNALLRQDWAGTSVWYTPAVTTTWLGSGSLAVYYQLHQVDISRSMTEWLLSFSSTKAELDILLALRWSVALFTALMAALVYGLARKLWPLPVALLGTLFLITEPHLLAVSRIIGHDALITFFVIASLLSLLYAKRRLAELLSPQRNWLQQAVQYRWFALSGLFAGLAILSKAPALILIPFAGLVAAVDIWLAEARPLDLKLSEQAFYPPSSLVRTSRLKQWIPALFIWGAGLWLTFIVIWPAAWVDPLGQSWFVVSSAFFSSAGLEDADVQPYWSIPDLGYFYYLVNGAYKISPFGLIGTLLAVIAGGYKIWREKLSWRGVLQNDLFWLGLFVFLFALMMTLSTKQSPRYILPAFPALSFIAAWGWVNVANLPVIASRPTLRRIWKTGTIAVLGTLAVLLTLNYAPYYFTYFNPLLGGALTAPQIVRIGWGEGLDELGRWLNTHPNATAEQVGTRYTATLYPFFSGQISSPVDPELDYVAFYIKQTQSGYPAPEILRYFENQTPLQRIRLNGIEYAQVYQGPGMQLVEAGDSTTLPLAFRPHTIYASIGQELTVDLLWPAGSARALGETVNLILQSPDAALELESSAPIVEMAQTIKVSRHLFELPSDMVRNTYMLLVDDKPIGQIKARLLNTPPDFEPLSAVLAGQIKLAGIRQWQDGNRLLVDLAWQGWPKAGNDYTVFVQLLDDGGQRVAGVDVAPERGFTGLDRKEMMMTHYDIPLPDNLQPGSYNLLIGLYYFAGNDLINVGAVPLEKAVTFE